MNETELRAMIKGTVLADHYASTGELLAPVNVSGRHVHLSQEAVNVLFGEGYQLTRKKDLVQLGQFACEETVTIRGKKKAIERVRVLGPVRPETQVEVSVSDCYVLGIPPTIRLSGNIAGSPGLTIEGPKGTLEIKEGAIVASRHLHVPTDLSGKLGLKNGDKVSMVTTGDRPSVLMGILVRVSDKALYEGHVDTDEANACGIKDDSLLKVIKEN